jgi:hypothetical protein
VSPGGCQKIAIWMADETWHDCYDGVIENMYALLLPIQFFSSCSASTLAHWFGFETFRFQLVYPTPVLGINTKFPSSQKEQRSFLYILD